MLLSYLGGLASALSLVLGLVFGTKSFLILVRLIRLYRSSRFEDDLSDDWRG